MKLFFSLGFLFILVALLFYPIETGIAQTPTTKGPCRDNPYPPPETGEENNFKYVWKADCTSEKSKSCKINADCPANTQDPFRVNPKTSNWCYEFDEGNRCMVLLSKRKVEPKAVQRTEKTKTYLKKLDKYKNSTDSALQSYIKSAKSTFQKNLGVGQNCANKINDGDKNTQECKDKVKEDYQKTKAFYRLVKYQAVLSGVPKVCVEADLGMQPNLKAKGITKIKEEDKNNPKETGKSANSRLYLCTGQDGKPKWRIVYNNKLLRVVPEDEQRLKLSTDLNNLATSQHFEKLKKYLGI